MSLKSNFEHVLDTNYIPSVEEVEQLRLLIRDPQERIQKLEKQLVLLRAECDELKRFMDRHRALLSPFRRLPPDIWGEIFVRCLPENDFNLYTCASTKPPLLFTTICRAWRTIACNTPRLWNSIHIYLPGQYPGLIGDDFIQSMCSRRDGVKLWLDRSGSLPLTVSVSMACSSAGLEPRIAFMNFLVGYSRRWKTLALGSGISICYQDTKLKDLTSDDVPLLENVYSTMDLIEDSSFDPILDASAPPAPPLPNALAQLLTKVTSLRSLHLVSKSLSASSTLDLPLGWSHLTELHLSSRTDSLTPGAILRRLAKVCHSMTTLSLQFDVFSTDVVCSGEMVDWPSLQEFNLLFEGLIYTSNDRNEAPSFHPIVADTFESINTPRLARFSIQFCPLAFDRVLTVRQRDILPFHHFVSRSTGLMYIQIRACWILDPASLSGCLQMARSMNTLVLRPQEKLEGKPTMYALNQAPVGGWIAGFLASLNGHPPLPELEVFDCGQCETEDLKSIVEFAGRWGGGASRLRCLKAQVRRLHEDKVELEGVVDTLGYLQATQGVSVELSWMDVLRPNIKSQYERPTTGLPVTRLGW